MFVTVLHLLVVLGITAAQQAPLSFFVDVAGYENHFYRDDVTAVQVLSTSRNSNQPQRFVAAFPSANSGAAAYFLPQSNASLSDFSARVRNNTLSSISYPDITGSTGVKGIIDLTGSASLGVTLLGGVRTLRDYVEGNGLTNKIFNYTLGDYNNTSVTLTYKWINGTDRMNLTFASLDSSALTFIVRPSVNTTRPPLVSFNLGSGTRSAPLAFSVVFNETLIGQGYDKADLFLQSALSGSSNQAGVNRAIAALATQNAEPATQVSFLTYRSKFLAGGWRFLTYFGRDTMFALRLLMPIMSPPAIESALAAVLERLYVAGTNAQPKEIIFEGEVCHEEAIGDYASFVNIANNRSDLGSTPFFDYKMIDTSYLLLPTLSHYFLALPQGRDRAPAFLATVSSLAATRGISYSSLLSKNIAHVLNATSSFAADPTFQNLLGLKKDVPVGNWRDSNSGLGYGNYPMDINIGLVSGCLRAIQDLAAAGIVSTNDGQRATRYAGVWETKAPQYFEVSTNTEVAFERLKAYTTFANLTQDQIYGEGPFNSSSSATIPASSLSPDSSASHGWISNNGSNHIAYALSLAKNGSSIDILNSDLGIALLYGNNLPTSLLSSVADALLPFPKGLLTPIGMLVANPAASRNTTTYRDFDRSMYHGTVVWSWQSGIMASGVLRALSFCPSFSNSSARLGDLRSVAVDVYSSPSKVPAYCSDERLIAGLREGLDRLWKSIEGSGPNKFAEVWSYDGGGGAGGYSVVDLGSLSPSGTESDAIQLWSYGFLALLDPRNQVGGGGQVDGGGGSGGSTSTASNGTASGIGANGTSGSNRTGTGGFSPPLPVSNTASGLASLGPACIVLALSCFLCLL